MATIEIRNLTFYYPMTEKPALDDITLDMNTSEFIVLCGKSGCGKSTLLRQLKKNMIPFGDRAGNVLYRGEEIQTMDDRRSACEIGFVQQNPDNQLVTDKVWHELAFGLESLGLDNASIKRRVAEMASFFGIQEWFRKNVADLSGGQKQLLNLASIMVMQPKVLILDEPTSQLDPIAAGEFLKTIYKINRDLGTTVIISEHRLEDLFPMADRVMVMDKGKIIANDSPWNIGEFLAGESQEDRHPMFYGLPSVMKIYSACGGKKLATHGNRENLCPLTIREGRLWLESVLGEPADDIIDKKEDKIESRIQKKKLKEQFSSEDSHSKKDNIISAKSLWFRYNSESGDILRGLNLNVKRGELYCLLGGNGVGKSTTLKAIAGIIKPQDGRITVDGIDVKKENTAKLYQNRLAMVPQNPQALFTELTCEEELLEALYYVKIPDEEKVAKVGEMLDIMEISHLRKTHPYDLSGGEQQRLAIGKILLPEPKILLLDEPTKGLDPFFKITLAGIFNKLKKRGVTIFMVSHDIEFCAQYGDTCAMFFDGDVVSVGPPKEFFAGNSFYTTTANQMARRWWSEAVTWEEVASWVEQATT